MIIISSANGKESNYYHVKMHMGGYSLTQAHFFGWGREALGPLSDSYSCLCSQWAFLSLPVQNMGARQNRKYGEIFRNGNKNII